MIQVLVLSNGTQVGGFLTEVKPNNGDCLAFDGVIYLVEGILFTPDRSGVDIVLYCKRLGRLEDSIFRGSREGPG